MKIDFAETRKRFEESCISQAKLGRLIGVDRTVINHVLAGRYMSMHGKSAQKIFQELRRREILVEIPDEDAAA